MTEDPTSGMDLAGGRRDLGGPVMKCTILGAALVLVVASGCCCGMPPDPFRIGPSDAGRDAPFVLPRDAGADAADTWETFPVACNTSGHGGAHCRDGVCATGLTCGVPAAGSTLQD